MSKYTLPLIILALTACAKNGATNETLSGPQFSQTRRSELGVVGFTDTFATGFASQIYLGPIDGYYDIKSDEAVTLTVDQDGDEVYRVGGPRDPNCPALYSGITIGATGRYRYAEEFFGAMSDDVISHDESTGLYSVPGLGEFYVLDDNPAKPVVSVDATQFDRLQILIDKNTGCMSVLKRNRI